MSSVTKRRCALGQYCAIAQHRVYDHSRDDWIEFQDNDKGMTLQTLLLKAEGAAGETLYLAAEDVRMELDYLTALDGGRYRCVVMLVLVLNVLSCLMFSRTFLTYMSSFFLRRVPLLGDTYIPYIHVSFFRSLFAARATLGGQRAGGPPALRRIAFGAGEGLC